jgi:hypothetical protein
VEEVAGRRLLEEVSGCHEGGSRRRSHGRRRGESTVAVDNRARTVDDAQGEAKGAERGVAIGASQRRCKQAATRRVSLVGWGWEQAKG